MYKVYSTDMSTDMDISSLIIEAADKIGMDQQTARDLHSALCADDSLAARYAAELVSQAINLYSQADNIIQRLASLADPSGNLYL